MRACYTRIDAVGRSVASLNPNSNEEHSIEYPPVPGLEPVEANVHHHHDDENDKCDGSVLAVQFLQSSEGEVRLAQSIR